MAVGLFSYDGIDLQSGSLHCGVACELVKDAANRTNIYHRYTITATFIVQNDAGTDVAMAEIRRKLTTSGAPLVYTGNGFDSLSCNGPGGNVDIKAGPHPTAIRWTNLGGGNAAEVEWQCVVCLPCHCGTGPLHRQGVLAYNYEASHSINDRGWTTRTISGYIEVIVARLTPTQAISDCADLYREQVALAVPPGFRRTQEWRVSADKSRLDFTITDSQIESPNAYPPGVVFIDADQTVTWSEHARGMLRANLDMEIELKPDMHKAAAYAMFLQLALSRINAAKLANKFPWIEGLRLNEKLYSYRSSFSVQWRVLGCIEDVLGPTGLWQPTGNNWNIWRASMANVFGHRGYAGLGVDAGNDLIVNICGSPGITLPNQNIAFPSPAFAPTLLTNQTPPPDKSWVSYDMSVSPSREQPVVRQAPLQQPANLNSQGSMNDTGGITFEGSNGTPDVLQKSGQPRYSFTLIGQAKRAGHSIPRPILTALGGVPLEEVASSFEQGYRMVMGKALYTAAWAIRYVMPSSPGTVPTANNKDTDSCAKQPGTVLQ